MSDADNQMGGSGGQTGRPPGGEPTSPASEEARAKDPRNGARDGAARDGGDDETVTEESEESFPASDPPANY